MNSDMLKTSSNFLIQVVVYFNVILTFFPAVEMATIKAIKGVEGEYGYNFNIVYNERNYHFTPTKNCCFRVKVSGNNCH